MKLEALKTDKRQVIEAMLDGPWPFACWRLPNQEEIHLLIGQQIEETDEPLNAVEPAFILNTYADNHPLKSLRIPGDLHLDGSNVWRIQPRVSATFLDEVQSCVDGGKHFKKHKDSNRAASKSKDYHDQVEEAVGAIKSGPLSKVVLSRYQDLSLKNFDAWSFFQDLTSAYPSAFCSLTHLPGKGIWMGATPEILLENTPHHFRTVALAGTKAMISAMDLTDVAWTQKEIEEQAMVSRYIINCFKAIRLREFHEEGPKTVQAGQLAHLSTDYVVNYNEVDFPDLASRMLELLHPTSAVCGMPRNQAQRLITKLEAFDRSYFAGFLGPVNMEGTSRLFVNLRCVHIQNQVARLFAGAGLTADSRPDREFKETELKMQTLKRWLQPYVASVDS